jgi:hypothetical protein
MFASIATLLAITVDRCFYIVKPLKYPLIVTKRRVFVAMAGIWLTTSCIFAVFLVHFRRSQDRLRSLCYLDDILFSPLIALTYYFPLTLTIILNVWILVVAEKQRKRILAETAINTNVYKFFHAHKAVKTFSIVVAVLTFCVLTPTVVGMVIMNISSCSDSCEQLWFVVFHSEFYGINSIVNAFIYVMRHIKYRKAPGQIVFKILRC